MKLEVITGNVLEKLPTLPAASINCCVTSPPYWNLRDYGEEGQLGSEKMHDCLGWATGSPCGECFVCHMVIVFREVRRVLRDDGVLWVNMGDSYAGGGRGGQSQEKRSTNWQPQYPNHGLTPTGLKPKDLCGVPWRMALALQADGWYLRRDIIWDKPNAMCESCTDRPTTSHEYVFILTKSASYWYDAAAIAEPVSDATVDDLSRRKNPGQHDGATKEIGKSAGLGAGPRGNGKTRNKRSVWSINTKPFPGSHFAVFPYELAETCIKAGAPTHTCAACGKPWERIVHRGNSEHHCRPGCGCSADQKHGQQNWGSGWQKYGNYSNTAIATDEFEATCKCNAESVPGTVLDPFSGAGTTGVVCRDLGLNYIGIELNPEYAEMSRERIADPMYEKKLRQHQRVERENELNLSLFD
jgi:DNA modification methylase